MTSGNAAAPRIRRATVSDAPAVLRLFDEAIAWFVEMGNEGQWGTEPWSAQEHRIARIVDECGLPGAWVAEHAEAGVIGALILGDAMPYVAPADQPELYVRLLIASRDPRARGTGRRLLAFAEEQARDAGVAQLRVDCYAGGSGSLVRFYESCGYKPLAACDVDGWPGQLLGRTLR